MRGTKLALGGAAVVAVIGALATAIDGAWDLFAVFVALVVLQGAVAGALFGGRRLVSVRADLARWVDERSALTGEPGSRIVDRSVAAYRATLGEPDGAGARADPDV